MSQCTIIEDLYPLYEEGLVHEDTATFIEEHLKDCSQCSSRLLGKQTELTAPVEKSKVSAAVSVKKTQSKLAVYQLLLMLLSFYFAMATNLFEESFGFILTYFILGLVIFLFYRSWLLTLLISFLPVFFIGFYETAMAPNAYRLYKGDHLGGNIFVFIWMHFIGAGFMAAMHTFFAMLGAVVGLFITKLKKEDAQ